MKFAKFVLSVLAFFTFVICLWIIWTKLPVSINRRSDIKLGNSIVEKIEKYRLRNALPEDGDWTTLRKFGFNEDQSFLQPEYQKINDTTFELIFVEGFDGPYLLCNSNDRIWKHDFPTIVDNNEKNKTIEKITTIVKQEKIVIAQTKLIDSLSFGHRHIKLPTILDDSSRNIYLVKVGEDNGSTFVSYYNFLVDGNTMTILNPTGKLEGQEDGTNKAK